MWTFAPHTYSVRNPSCLILDVKFTNTILLLNFFVPAMRGLEVSLAIPFFCSIHFKKIEKRLCTYNRKECKKERTVRILFLSIAVNLQCLYFSILQSVGHSWKRIERRSFHHHLHRLYSYLVSYDDRALLLPRLCITRVCKFSSR